MHGDGVPIDAVKRCIDGLASGLDLHNLAVYADEMGVLVIGVLSN